jgi:hypothetical protein
MYARTIVATVLGDGTATARIGISPGKVVAAAVGYAGVTDAGTDVVVTCNPGVGGEGAVLSRPNTDTNYPLTQLAAPVYVRGSIDVAVAQSTEDGVITVLLFIDD